MKTIKENLLSRYHKVLRKKRSQINIGKTSTDLVNILYDWSDKKSKYSVISKEGYETLESLSKKYLKELIKIREELLKSLSFKGRIIKDLLSLEKRVYKRIESEFNKYGFEYYKAWLLYLSFRGTMDKEREEHLFNTFRENNVDPSVVDDIRFDKPLSKEVEKLLKMPVPKRK